MRFGALAISLKAAVLVTALAVAAPASALTINIDASAQGTGDPDEGNVPVSFTAGTYALTLVDGANDGDPSTLYTAWSFAASAGTWRTVYRVTFEDDSFIEGGSRPDVDSPAEAFFLTFVKTLIFEVPTDQTVRFHLTDAVGSGFDNRGGVTLVTAPEPSTALLMGLGLVGVIVGGRRGSRRPHRRGVDPRS